MLRVKIPLSSDRNPGQSYAAQKPSPRSKRAWASENMDEAYDAVTNGQMSISAAARAFNVPRMTLSDRVNKKVGMGASWGGKPALSTEDEEALISYIDYMQGRGFPLTVSQVRLY